MLPLGTGIGLRHERSDMSSDYPMPERRIASDWMHQNLASSLRRPLKAMVTKGSHGLPEPGCMTSSVGLFVAGYHYPNEDLTFHHPRAGLARHLSIHVPNRSALFREEHRHNFIPQQHLAV